MFFLFELSKFELKKCKYIKILFKKVKFYVVFKRVFFKNKINELYYFDFIEAQISKRGFYFYFMLSIFKYNWKI